MAIIKPEQLSSGPYNISGSFSGSFQGDGSGLINIPTQSFETGSFVTTSSFNSFTGSYNTGSFTGSFTGNGSGLTGIISSSFALTASYAVSASYEINYETSSSYAETASVAISASYAETASFVQNAQTASYVLNAVSSSYALSASFAPSTPAFPFTGSALITGSLGVTGSASILAFTSSNAAIFNVRNSAGNKNIVEIRGDGETRWPGLTVVGNYVAIKNYTSYDANIDLMSGDGVKAQIFHDVNSNANINRGLNLWNPGIVGSATAKINNLVKSGLQAYGEGYGFNWAFTSNASGIYTQAERAMWLTHRNSLVLYTSSTAPTDAFSEKGGAFEIYASSSTTTGGVAAHFNTNAGTTIWLGNQSLLYNITASSITSSFTGSLLGTSSYATQALSASFAPTPSGPFGIANTSGVYTYYSTFSASMAAATSGQTVEMFADIIETGSVTVTLKNGVNINGNGYTYTLNNSGTIHALSAPITVNTSCNVLNLNVVRTGSTGTITDNSALVLSTNGTGTINCAGSTFRNLGNGCGIVFNTNSGHEVNYAVAYATTTWGAIGMFTSYGARLNNSIGYGTSGGFGIRCHNGGDIQNCTGVSDSSYGIYGLSGNQSNSVGISSTGNGFFAAATAFNCVGRSTSGIGVEAQNGTNIVGCVGISVSGRGLATQNAIIYNCTGISSSSSGMSLSGISKAYNITAKSSTSYALWGTLTTCPIYGGTIICDWNNAAGYGIRGNGGFISNTIINCTFNLSNASAPYLFNDGVAQAISMRGNTYQGGATFNVNLTQAIVATEDAQGNIFL